MLNFICTGFESAFQELYPERGSNPTCRQISAAASMVDGFVSVETFGIFNNLHREVDKFNCIMEESFFSVWAEVSNEELIKVYFTF